jgi:hypothetical protein
MTTIALHPALAAELARAINDRAVASNHINDLIYREHIVMDDWTFWRDEHIRATARLAEFGIGLPTYNNWKEFLPCHT